LFIYMFRPFCLLLDSAAQGGSNTRPSIATHPLLRFREL
jgi:hypothetical protein